VTILTQVLKFVWHVFPVPLKGWNLECSTARSTKQNLVLVKNKLKETKWLFCLECPTIPEEKWLLTGYKSTDNFNTCFKVDLLDIIPKARQATAVCFQLAISQIVTRYEHTVFSDIFYPKRSIIVNIRQKALLSSVSFGTLMTSRLCSPRVLFACGD